MTDHTIATVRARMAAGGIDSLVVTRPPNIRYLTGYPGDSAHAVLTADRIVLFVFPLNHELAETTVDDDVEIILIVDTSVYQVFGSLGVAFWGETTGYDPNTITCAVFEKLDGALAGTALREVPNLIETARTVKTSVEVDSILAAQKITDRVFGDVAGMLREGITEREAAAEIDYRFRLAGGDGPAFPTIVAFGPHAALPHAVPDDTPLKAGDIVLIDMGTIAAGYASDMTRTLVFGRADRTFRDRYRTVLDAQQAGIESIHSGVKCAVAYHAAQAVFEAAGCADAFIHSLGHGVGLEVHELPTLSPRSTDTVPEGAVVTIEPGLYYPGWGGIRIEDMALVTADGHRMLTGTHKTLIEL